MHLCFEFPKDEVDFLFLIGIFQYLVHIPENLHELESFEPLPTYLGVRASKFAMDEVVVPRDPSSPSRQTTLVPQVEAGEVENSYVNPPPSSPTPHTQNFSTILDCQFDGCDEVLSCHTPSFGPFDPPDCDVLCSPMSNISFDVHEDQVLDGVGVEQPTCGIIFDEYVWEYEQESVVKDDLLLSTPLPHYPNIFHDSIILVEPCEKSVFVDFTTFDHSQNTWNANFPSECGEDNFFLHVPPNLSSYLFRSIESEISCFASSPLYDFLYHEDASVSNLELWSWLSWLS